MPVVFSHEINPPTLNGRFFKITTRDGSVRYPSFVTFKPASEAFELRTVLLIGEMGSALNPPVQLEIVGDLRTSDGQPLQGTTVTVTALEAGPLLVYAEYFQFDHDYPYVSSGRGCDCPQTGTGVVVRTVWAGGVRALNQGELGDNELAHFTVRLRVGNDTLSVHPYRLADTGDNDNNVDLCLHEKGVPLSVEVTPQTAMDPRNDPNPFTKIPVVSRW